MNHQQQQKQQQRRRRSSSSDGQKENTNYEDNDRAQQPMSKRARHTVGTTPIPPPPQSAMGVLEEVYCENFMCHRKLRVTFGRNINFITGENGSGKSAIIAALQICFGGSARLTHRGKSLKHLIRREHTGSALVRIVLLNDDQGSDAYRYQDFGDRIVIERVLRPDGSSSYVLKRRDGHVVSRHKRDIDAMVDHLNIQIDNPCAILDQDTAKKFLQGDAKEKYKFFLKATDLYNMKSMYQSIKETRDFVQSCVYGAEREKLTTLQTARDEAHDRMTQAQEYERLEEMKQEIKANMCSAMLAVRERDLDGIREKYATVERECEAAMEEEAELQRKTENSSEKLQQQTAQLEVVRARKEAADKKIKQASQALRDRRVPLTTKEQEIKDARKRIVQQERKISSAKRQIEQETRNYESSRDGKSSSAPQLQEAQAQMDALNDSILRDETRLRELQEDEQAAATRAHDKNVELLYASQRTLRGCQEELRQKEKELMSLRAHTKNQVAVFGDKVPAILAKIKQFENKFRSKPIGPIGAFVKLPAESKPYSLAIEVVLGGTLKSFLVENGQDKALLEKIKASVNCPPSQCPILMKKRVTNRRHAVVTASGALAKHVMSNLIHVQDDFVFNAMVDNTSMETHLVFPDRKSAEDAIFLGPLGQQTMPQNVASAFIANGDQTFIRNGNQAYVPNKKIKRASLDTDVASLLQQVQASVDQLRHEQAQLQHCVRENQQRVDQSKRSCDAIRYEIEQLDERLSGLRQQVFGCEEKIRHLREQEHQHLELDVSPYEMDIQDAMQEIERCQALIERLGQEIADSRADLDQAVLAVQRAQDDKEQASIAYDEMHQDVESVYEFHASTKRAFLHKQKQLGRCRVKLEEMAATRESVQRDIEAKLKQLEELYGPRRPVSESVEFYQQQYRDLEYRIEHERHKFDGMDLDDLKHDYEVKHAKFARKQAELQAFEQNSEQLSEKVQERDAKWKILRKHIANRASQQFNRTMELRDFAGKLKFNHAEETLDIVVLRQDVGVTKSSQVKDMKSLSGGERSYAQIALLLALADSLECPFRVMDEFDVYMDSVNRTLSMELLIAAAKTDLSKQFIFVTPNDLSTLQQDRYVRIQKLQAPRPTTTGRGDGSSSHAASR